MTKLRKLFAYLFFILSAFAVVACFFSKYNHGFDYFLITVIPLFACGVICLFVKKHTALYCIWTLFGFLSLWEYVYRLTHWRMMSFYLFDDSMKDRIAPAWTLFAIFAVLVIITVGVFCKNPVTDSKKHKKTLILTAVGCVVIRNLFNILRIILPQNMLYKFMESNALLSNIAQWSMSSIADFLFILLAISVAKTVYTKIKNNR